MTKPRNGSPGPHAVDESEAHAFGPLSEERTAEIAFDAEGVALNQHGRRFSAARVREAGMTGGETGRGEVTADDLAPETLIDEDGGDGPHLYRGGRAADTTLREVDLSDIGAGIGADEAELAEAQPVGRDAGNRRIGHGAP